MRRITTEVLLKDATSSIQPKPLYGGDLLNATVLMSDLFSKIRRADFTLYLFVMALVSLSVIFPVGFAHGVADSQAAPFEVSKEINHKTNTPAVGPSAPRLRYPESYGATMDNRSLLWVFIQQHFFLGSFILGVPMIAWMLELFGHLRRKENPESSLKQDSLAREIMMIGLPFYPWTIFMGVALLAAFLLMYAQFFGYMSQLFKPVLYLYALCFLLESVLLYAYALTWDRWRRGEYKWHHLSLGLLTVTNGVVIIALANAWMSFMMSPAGVDGEGRSLGNIWTMVQTPFWRPLNVHRILASIMFSGAVIAAYAAYRFLTTTDSEKKAHYDWMGHVSIMIAIVNLFFLPFAGYWFAKVVFVFRQRMGMTLMGGKLSWPFVIQAMLIGLIFMTVTYYLWQGMARMKGAERYQYFAKYLLMILCVSFMIWSTPHTVPASQGELTAMGGAQHPVVGNYGTMAAKNTAINTMILAFGLSFMIFQRCNKVVSVGWSRYGNIALIALFVGAEFNIIALGIYGHYVPANVRVGLALPQFVSAISTLLIGGGLNWAMLRRAQTPVPTEWGKLPIPGAVALFVLAFLITVTMSLMGYIRSSVRLSWHITEIMEDVTPWAHTPSLSYAIGMICLNVVIFWCMAAFVLWTYHARKMVVPSNALPAEIVKPNEPLVS